MNKKNLRKTTRGVLLVTFLMIVGSAFIHHFLSHRLFLLLHVVPGIVFTVFTFIHMKLNNYPAGRLITEKVPKK